MDDKKLKKVLGAKYEAQKGLLKESIRPKCESLFLINAYNTYAQQMIEGDNPDNWKIAKPLHWAGDTQLLDGDLKPEFLGKGYKGKGNKTTFIQL